jgi:DNA modification methylase
MSLDYQTFGPITLYRGDMREVLPQLGCKADLICSDPPYLLTSGGNTTGEMKGLFAHGAYDNSGALFPIVPWDELAPICWQALAENADAIIMTSDREEGKARAALEAVGFRFHRLLVWDKGTVTPNRWFMPNCEFALYVWRGKPRVISNPASQQLIKVPHRDETDHPTEKPVILMRHWIECCSDRGDLVLDPFLGSGSTMLAALQSGRRGIGIELSQRWFDVACARLERALSVSQAVLL